MSNLFITSDLHLYHENMLRGRKIGIRPFETLDQMHETLVQNWNRVVGPQDKVYVLGDITLSRSPERLNILRELRGRLRLVLGNHDTQPLTTYLVYFEKVFAVRTLADIVLTHIPLHPVEFDRWKGNIHGHRHDRSVTRLERTSERWVPTDPSIYPDGGGVTRETIERVPDTRYVNACVEVNAYTPQPFDVLRERLR